MGDSITYRWVLTEPEQHPAGVRVGRGISAQVSSQTLLRFRQHVVNLRPSVVHIMVGTNHFAGNQGPTSYDLIQNNMQTMVDLAEANGIVLIVGSSPPVATFDIRPARSPAPQVIRMGEWLRACSRDRGLVFADYHQALTTTDGAMRPELTVDGIHPNPAGYALMDLIAERAIQEALRKTPRGPRWNLRQLALRQKALGL